MLSYNFETRLFTYVSSHDENTSDPRQLNSFKQKQGSYLMPEELDCGTAEDTC